MNIAITIAVMILIPGIFIGAIVFAARRAGWVRVIRYVKAAVGIRVAMQVSGSKNTSGSETILVPLIGAVAIEFLWPHIVAQRAREQAELANEAQFDENSRD
jgi:hypothetical protein